MSGLRVALAFVFLLISSPLFAQSLIFEDSSFLQSAREAIDLTYAMEYDRAEEVLRELQKVEPEHPAPYFLLGFNRFWQTYISVSMTIYLGEIEEHLETALEKSKALKKDPEFALEYTFFQFMTYAIRARIKTMQKQWWPAVISARKVIPYLKDGFDYKDQRPEFYFSSGIYHYYAATYVQQYPIVKPFMIFFPNGDLELGLEEMRTAARLPSFAQTEALFYLTDIYLNERQEYAQGLWAAQKLNQKHRDNTLFQAIHAHALVMNQRYDEAEVILAGLIDSYQKMFGYDKTNITSLRSDYTTQIMFKVWHYQGKLLLLGRQDYPGAIAAFARSDELARIAGIEKDLLLPANRYFTGLCHDRLGQRQKALEAYEQALKMDDSNWIKDRIKDCQESPCTG